MFGAVQFINVLILTLKYVQLFNSVKVTELPPARKRAANSAYLSSVISFFVKICLSIFPFDV